MVAIFWSWQSVVLTLLIYALTEASRRLVQSVWSAWRKSKLYNEFVLWSAPVVNGALVGAFAFNFPWQVGLETIWARATYCVALGLFCGTVYGRIKKFVETGDPPRP